MRLIHLFFVEYVDLYVKYLLEDSIKKQFDEFLKGFKMVCDSDGFRVSARSFPFVSFRFLSFRFAPHSNTCSLDLHLQITL